MADVRFPSKKRTEQVARVFILICLAGGLIWEVPRRQVDVSRDRLTAKEAIDAETSARTGWSQLLVGSFVAFGAFTAWRTYQFNVTQAERNFKTLVEKQEKDVAQAEKNFQAIQEKNTADRFSKAIEQLGNDGNIHVRLGGIFALEQIANTEDKYYWQIMEILTAYVRTRSPSSPDQEKISEDIQAVMKVLSRRRFSYQHGEDVRLDLNDTNLRNLRLQPNAKLQGANLRNTCLTDAFMHSVNLDGADLRDSVLERVELRHANLREARLWNVDMRGAFLDHAILIKTDLRNSNLSNAYLENANLEQAILHKVTLCHAEMDEANLSCARLNRANLEHAYLGNANLHGANLRLANLQNTSFNGADCQWANFTGANFKETDFNHAILASADIPDGDNAIGLPPEESGVVSYCEATLPSYLRQANSNSLDHASP